MSPPSADIQGQSDPESGAQGRPRCHWGIDEVNILGVEEEKAARGEGKDLWTQPRANKGERRKPMGPLRRGGSLRISQEEGAVGSDAELNMKSPIHFPFLWLNIITFYGYTTFVYPFIS